MIIRICHKYVVEKTPPSSKERDKAQLKRAQMLMRERESPFDPLGQLYIGG